MKIRFNYGLLFFLLVFIALVSDAQITVDTYAGSTAGYADGPALSAKFSLPKGITRDCAGNIYIAEWNSTGKIRKIDVSGNVSTVTQSGFNSPNDIAYDATTNTLVFVEFGGSNRIMRTDMSGNLLTIAGNGSGYLDGPVATAKFNMPAGLAIAANGDIYVADFGNHAIRKISGGIVSTFAGNGTSGCADGNGTNARFKNPTGLAFDNNGNLIVADYLNHMIRKIDPSGNVSTVAGTCGVTGSDPNPTTVSASLFNEPHGVFVDYIGNIYVAEFNNHWIKKIDLANDLVTTVAGTGAPGYVNGPGSSAQFNQPFRVCGTLSGTLYIPDSQNDVIRVIYDQGLVPQINLNNQYCINDAPVLLNPFPDGGVLSGPGINGDTLFPSQAGPGQAIISYTITDLQGCTMVTYDTTIVAFCGCDSTSLISEYVSDTTLFFYVNTYSGNDTDKIYLHNFLPDTNINAVNISISNNLFSSTDPIGNLNPGDSTLFDIIFSAPDSCLPDTFNGYIVLSSQCPVINDTLWLTAYYNPPSVIADAGSDQTICAGQNASLTAFGGNIYLWNTGTSVSAITVGPTVNTIYIVTVANNGCTDTDDVAVTVDPLPSVYLGADTCIYSGDAIILDAGTGVDSYLWQNGNTSQTCVVSDAGNYSITVTNYCGSAYDTIAIFECVTSCIWLPNAFTPNGDGNNDMFYPVWTNIAEFELHIFDRWGNEIYKTTDINKGWDGKCESRACPEGVYPWLIFYKGSDSNVVKKKYGYVIIIK